MGKQINENVLWVISLFLIGVGAALLKGGAPGSFLGLIGGLLVYVGGLINGYIWTTQQKQHKS